MLVSASFTVAKLQNIFINIFYSLTDMHVAPPAYIFFSSEWIKNLLMFQFTCSYGAIEAKKGNPPISPAVMTPGGPLDLSSVLFRNRIIFIGQPVNSQVAQRVISQLVTLATIDEKSDILVC